MLLHGFTQNQYCWAPFDRLLAAEHDVVAVDLPGHGRSGHDDASLDEAADLVAEAAGRGVYVGYSLGGRVLLHLALRHPEVVEAMVVIGAHAGLDTDAERAERRANDEALAQRILELGTEAFVDRWLTNPLFAGLTPETAHRNRRLLNRPEALAASLRHTGTGTQRPLWDDLAGSTVPTLVAAGADDVKFDALGRRLADTIGPAATFTSIEGSGHTCQLERPEATAHAITTWLTSHA